MLATVDIEALYEARHADPFAVLGPHRLQSGERVLRVFLPGAAQLEAIETGDVADGHAVASSAARRQTLSPRHVEGFFEGPLPKTWAGYRLAVRWSSGDSAEFEDPYRFGTSLADEDAWLLAEGTHERPYEILGATPCLHEGVAGTRFVLWAPNAARVSVVGDFNAWDARRHPMRLRHGGGLWDLFLPAVEAGALYKYEIRTHSGSVLALKADPYARASEYRPATASCVAALPPSVSSEPERARINAVSAPISIYEVHVGSWRRRGDADTPFLDWDDLADSLIPYVKDLGFTHLELLPVTEHPFDGSWGYQPTGMYAPSARQGDPQGLRRFIVRCHAEGLGVWLDWVPAHFPTDPHGLARFDGTALYEHADPREGYHPDWNTLIYNYGRREVCTFLAGSALYWLERFGADGLRVDAVASMLYRDYSRAPGEWIPNVEGGRENLEAIAFLRRLNTVISRHRPDAAMIAEESTAFPDVTRPASAGGLGFRYKWNLGWMNDTLRYMARDPVHRRHHHDEITFGLWYAFSEQFVLPISHDEVVHGKGSLLGRMPGDRWQRFANLRAYLGFMFAHPGKKLLFMGCEFAQEREWNHETSLDWHLLEDPAHRGVQALVRDLNRLYRSRVALHELDTEPAGFEWLEANDAERSVFAFVRRARDPSRSLLVVSHFTPLVREGYRLGVPDAGTYHERLNTDSTYYGGSNVGAPEGAYATEPVPSHGYPQSIVLRLPPLATVFLERSA